MTGPAIREMRVADLPATIEVRTSTIENAITLEEMREVYGLTPASIAASMAGTVRGWVCEESGRIVGFAMGDAASGEVGVVAVRPEAERRGIGKAVLVAVQEWLFASGHTRLWLLANPDPSVRASGFYARLGWRDSGRMQGEDVVLELVRAPK